MKSTIIVDTFQPGVVPEIDYVAMGDRALSWRVAAGDELALEEWRRRFEPPTAPTTGITGLIELHGKHNQKTHGRRYGKGGGVTTVQDVHQVEDDLLVGRDTEMGGDGVEQLMEELKTLPSTNLAKLQIRREPNCYRRHARNIARKDMPQLPETPEELGRFRQGLASRGIGGRIAMRDPRTLHMTQNQLDSAKVAKLYGYIHEGGWRADSTMIADRDGNILDGHHRWAAASAARMIGDDFSVRVLVVDTDIDTLLAVGNEYSGRKKGMAEGFAAKPKSPDVIFGEPTIPPPSETEPWMWIDGEWHLIVTDTSDDVPEDIDYVDEPKTR